MDAPEYPALEYDQAEASKQHWPRRPVCTKQAMAKDYERRSHRRPGAQKTGKVGRFRAAAPKASPGMNDEPVERNGQMQKQNERSKPARRFHPRILLERTITVNRVSTRILNGLRNTVSGVITKET